MPQPTPTPTPIATACELLVVLVLGEGRGAAELMAAGSVAIVVLMAEVMVEPPEVIVERIVDEVELVEDVVLEVVDL